MKPNVLLIVIDSLRSDHCHGENKTSDTPNLDRLIKNGALFTASISPAASTAISLGSMFTGLFPFNTGMSGEKYEKMDPSLQNYITLFERNGYSTHATQSDLTNMLGITNNFKFQFSSRKNNNFHSLFDGFGEKIVDKLNSHETRSPWMFYIHLNDLHRPIIVPEEFAGKEYGITEYAKMISAIDSWIGRIVSLVDLNETLVVITADHGEYVNSIIKDGAKISTVESSTEKTIWKMGNMVPAALDLPKQKLSKILQGIRSRQRRSVIEKSDLTQHEIRSLTAIRMGPGHHIFDDTLVVPLIFSGFGVKKGPMVKQQVRNVDIFPTMAHLCKINSSLTPDGKSLVPLMNGDKVEEDPAYIESMPATTENVKIVGVRTSKFKYFRRKNKPDGMELYNLEKDPHENINVIKDFPNVAGDLEEILQKFLKQSGKKKKSVLKDDERARVEEELKKMGYI